MEISAGEPPDHHREHHLQPDFKCSETEENSGEIVTCQLYACGLRHIHNGSQPQAPLHFIFFGGGVQGYIFLQLSLLKWG